MGFCLSYPDVTFAIAQIRIPLRFPVPARRPRSIFVTRGSRVSLCLTVTQSPETVVGQRSRQCVRSISCTRGRWR
eukprot:7199966-Prymnesium_polylepis.1